jgi:hypothetical protein
MNKIHNKNEAEQLKLIKDLQELPKIKAPDNFEFNLMTRIRNQNFGKQKEDRLQFNFFKFLAPSAVVVTVIILFFIFFPLTNQNNNSLQTPSGQMIVDNSSTISKGIAEKNANLSAQNNVKNNSLPSNERTFSNQQMQSPLNNPRAIKVDDYISNENAKHQDLERGNIVNGGNEPAQYDGFFYSEKPDKKTLEKYRTKIDSIKKAQFRADSLKKLLKIP